MLVILSIGSQEYKLQLRLQFSDYTCKCHGLLGVNKQDVFQPAQLWQGIRQAGLPEQPVLHHFTELAKLFHRLQFALLSVPGFQNHILCSPYCDLVLLGMQECCRGFTGVNVSARLDCACYPT